MAREAGLDRTSTGQLNTTARSGGIARQINGVGVDVNGVVYVDSMATTTAPSTLVNAGLRVTSDGAICVTTTDPGNTRMRNGIKVSAAGELFASTTAPVSTAVRTYDPLLGSILVSADGALHVSNGAVAPASFSATLLSTLVPQVYTGSSTPTFTRATTAYVTDFEGLLKQVPSGASRHTGARFVSNLCPTSSASIAVAGNKTITVGVGVYVFSMGAEATGTSVITFTGTATGSSGNLTANATKRTAATLTITAAGTIIATCTVTNAADIQFEQVTGQSNQNPSEYVSVGVASAPYHGAGVDGVKYFTTENGNTVSSNVVTEATGAAISSATLLGYQSEGARTNICLQSQTFGTTWVVTSTTVTADTTTAPDGTTTADTITLTAGTTAKYINQSSLTVTNPNTFSVYAKAGTHALVQLAGNISTNNYANFDLTNGVVGSKGSNVSTSSITSVGNSWYRLTATFATVDITICYVVAISATTDAWGPGLSISNTGTFYLWGAQVENAAFASSYIPTTTVAVTRNGEIDSYVSASNIAAAAGSIVLTYTPTHTPSGTVALFGTYVDASNYTAILHDATNLIFRKRIAGTNYDATIANSFVAGTAYKMGCSWGAAGTSIVLGGTVGTPHANTTDAQIGTNSQVGADGNSLQQPAASIKNLAVYASQLTDAALQTATT